MATNKYKLQSGMAAITWSGGPTCLPEDNLESELPSTLNGLSAALIESMTELASINYRFSKAKVDQRHLTVLVDTLSEVMVDAQ